ncbi:MAG: quinolinate synthase NadA [bacterium]|nr:quinolinate synthase NadA [bacterium]
MTQEEILNRIKGLKKEKKALILAHNYQRPEVQAVADITGDSLELARAAAKTDSEIIVLCGVKFMAETAAILNPGKKVLLPERNAGCPMADMVTADELRALKNKYPGVPVVTYINSTAEVKAESTVCCTSSNAVDVVNSVDGEKVIFVPDKNLGAYVSSRVDKQLILWNGCCYVHDCLTREEVLRVIDSHSGAKVIAHPECRSEVLKIADAVLSTSGMLDYAKKTDAMTIIVATEIGMLWPLKKTAPGKNFIPASFNMVCRDMKSVTIESVLSSLEEERFEIKVPGETGKKALNAIRRMLSVK